MNIATVRKLATATVVTGVATVALAAPASAARVAPHGDTDPGGGVQSTSTDQGWEFAQVATGAVGGVVLVGAGAAAVGGVRRHRRQVAHPA